MFYMLNQYNNSLGSKFAQILKLKKNTLVSLFQKIIKLDAASGSKIF